MISIDKIRFEQLELHPEILDTVNVEAMEWLFSNQLSPEILFAHIELNPIPVVRNKKARVNVRYYVTGSIIEFLWLLKLSPFCSLPNIQISVRESFDIKQSLGSIAFDTWARRSGPGPNAISAALFMGLECFRKENRFPSMAYDHLVSSVEGKSSRLKHFTGFDSRALMRSGELSEMPNPLQQYVITQLGLKVDLEMENLKEIEVAE